MVTQMGLNLKLASFLVGGFRSLSSKQSSQSHRDLFTDAYVEQPLWLDDVPPQPELDSSPPKAADVVVIGAGYTGLNAALQTVRGGRSTVVLEAGVAGSGCSTRNGGQISTSIKPSLGNLARRFGFDRARAIRGEGVTALDWLETFVTTEDIACDFHRCGRFYAAHTPKHFEELAKDADSRRQKEGMDSRVVTKAEQHSELGTDFYHGGVVQLGYAAIHPGRYHQGLLQSVVNAGVDVVPHCAAQAIKPEGKGFRVITAKHEIIARNVIVATNGYTSELTPWLRRRVIPIGSYVIATEPLPVELVNQLFPTDRTACDTRRVVYYYRASPDRRRIVFGGRVAARETDPRASAPRLHREMSRIFPQLETARVSHSWQGFVAYSFDELPHTGVHGGVHFAMGYCGSGVSMASYLGMKIGLRVLGSPEGRTALDDLPFPTRPAYTGTPWFLPPVVAWYRWRDEIEYRRHARSRVG